MKTILLALLQPVLASLFRAFADSVTGYLRDRRLLEDAKARAVAEALAETARTAVLASERMAGVELPEDAEALAALRAGQG